ncbi:MAG: hypothetical protein WKF80_02825 [Thermomicrobiales bacterium]
MDILIRRWVGSVLRSHRPLLTIAVRQRAQMEGWLKFELARVIEREGYEPVRVEAGFGEVGFRSDISFVAGGDRFDVELKTPNTNWSVPGVESPSRPVTKNIASIIVDAAKLRSCPGHGIVCFVLFPVPARDRRWVTYLERISRGIGVPLTPSDHCSRVKIPLGQDRSCDVVVCAFPVSGTGLTSETKARSPTELPTA